MSLRELLRHTRASTGLSQHRLALELGISQRHVSFLESGRARPSRELLLAWMREVRAPTSIRNAALIHAGFGQNHSGDVGDPDARAGVRGALSRILGAHHPYPGVSFDCEWVACEMNGGARWLCCQIMPEYWASAQCRGHGVDTIEALIHPGGVLSRMRDPQVAGFSLLRQLRAEEWVTPSLKARADALESALTRRFGLPLDDAHAGGMGQHLTLRFDTSVGPLAFYTLESVFGLPQDVTVGSMRLELWFPADQTTREVLLGATDSPVQR